MSKTPNQSNQTKSTNTGLKSFDHFFKKSMSRPKVAREFFEMNLPKEVLKLVKLDTLELQNSSFIDNTLGEGIVDLLYKVQFGDTEGYIWLLCEHQTTPDKLMTFRMQKYMLRICDKHIKQNPSSKLPLVYPMVVYSGASKYNATLSFYELFDNAKLAQQFFTQPLHLVDVSKIKEEELRKNIYAGLFLHFLHKIYEQDILPSLKEFAQIIHTISEIDFNYVEDLLLFVIEKGEASSHEEVIHTLKTIVTDSKKDKIMTIADMLREDGRKAGLEAGMLKGIEAGMLRGKEEGLSLGLEKGKLEGLIEGKLEVSRKMLSKGLDIKTISEVVDLDIEKIKELADSNKTS